MVCIINFTFSCQKCWKSHFRASKFQNFLGADAYPQTPLEKVAFGHLNSHSRLLLYGQTPTLNLIESPALGLCSSRAQWPLAPNFYPRRLKNLRFFIQIICWAPWILQLQSTGLPSIFLRAQPCIS